MGICNLMSLDVIVSFTGMSDVSDSTLQYKIC